MIEPILTIQNAANITLNNKAGFAPQMGSALQGDFQPMTFILVDKGVSGGMVVESGDANQSWTAPDGTVVSGAIVNFMGAAPIPKMRFLNIRNLGQRSWAGWDFFSAPQLKLQNDDCVIYNNVQYRVDAVWDYSLNQFMHYFLTEDYVFSGPLVPGLPQ